MDTAISLIERGKQRAMQLKDQKLPCDHEEITLERSDRETLTDTKNPAIAGLFYCCKLLSSMEGNVQSD
ncbi:MAG: hypothetical protein ABW148_17425 [Sedimenticola sp.]